MSKKQQIRNSTAEFLIFTTQSAEKSIEARYEDETIWLIQKLMATLFEVEVNTINYHLKEIFKAEELQENSVIRNFRITAADGKNDSTTLFRTFPIASAQRSQLNTQPYNGLKQGIIKQLEGVKDE